MESHFSPEVLEGLSRARDRAQRLSKRLRLAVDGAHYPILRIWDGGFALSTRDIPHLRGTVEICDGSRVLHECLIVCAREVGPEMHFEVKRMQRATDEGPLDFLREENAPVALIEG